MVKNLEAENFLVSIDQASIEYQSSRENSNQNFYRNFDRSKDSVDQSRDRIDRSKIWKNQNFEKQNNLMQKLLKA